MHHASSVEAQNTSVFGVVFTVLPSSDSHLPGRKSKVVLQRYGPFNFSFSFLKLRANFKLKQVLLE